MTSRITVVFVICHTWAAALAFQSPEPTPQDASPDAPQHRPGGDDSREHLTAEDVLRELQRQRPANLPIQAVETGPRRSAAQGALLPEGFGVVDVPGTIVQEELPPRWWTLAPTDAASCPPMRLLPNGILQPMARTVLGTEPPPQFVVSGETTVFEGRNYLLLTYAATLQPRRPSVRQPGAVVPPPTAEGKAGSRSAASENAELPLSFAEPSEGDTPDPGGQTRSNAPTETAIPPDAPVEDVLRLLQQERPHEDPIAMVEISPASSPPETGAAAAAILPQGSLVVQRPGRLVRQQDWWTFLFESDHPDHPEPGVRVLPNGNLELMAQTTELGERGTVFIISGVMTLFEGENYLLVRTARLRADSGNLRR